MTKNKNKAAPIGFFDSGVGGTSVWRQVISLLPKENTIYLADSINAPYGIKSKEEITRLSVKNTELLIQKGCKIIAIPCNTATTNSIAFLRQHYDLPFIGIEPAIKPAALRSTSRTIGILATKGTLSSALFERTANQVADDIDTIEVDGTGIVELIEGGHIASDEMRLLLENILTPLKKGNIDYLVLGCSHYPYIKAQISDILGASVKIIDSGAAVARQTKAILERHDLLQESEQHGQHQVFTNKTTPVIAALTKDVPHKSVYFLDF